MFYLVMIPCTDANGGGKSLCYQIPAELLKLDGCYFAFNRVNEGSGGCVEGVWISAAFLNSTLSSDEQSEILQQLPRKSVKITVYRS